MGCYLTLKDTVRLVVSRNSILETAAAVLVSADLNMLSSGNIWITFADEVGFGSGVSKEVFQCLSKELTSEVQLAVSWVSFAVCLLLWWFFFVNTSNNEQKYNIFRLTENQDSYHPVQDIFTSVDAERSKTYYLLAGIIIGLAIAREGVFLDISFSIPMLKKLTGQHCDLSDLEALDRALYNSILWLHQQDKQSKEEIADIVQSYFVAHEAHPDTRADVSIDLIPGGSSILIDNENKDRYVELLWQWKTSKSCEQALKWIKTGINRVFAIRWLQMFSASELQLLISGLPTIDVIDWKENTTLEGYCSNSKQMLWFWEVVSSLRDEGLSQQSISIRFHEMTYHQKRLSCCSLPQDRPGYRW